MLCLPYCHGVGQNMGMHLCSVRFTSRLPSLVLQTLFLVLYFNQLYSLSWHVILEAILLLPNLGFCPQT